jgi:hypothetical protein
VLAHDEVRQWAAMAIGIAKEPKSHSSARRSLDSHHLGRKLEALLAGKVDRELGGSARLEVPGRPHEGATSRYVLDKSVEDEPVNAELSPRPDRDSYGCPLVHVVKVTLATYKPDGNRLASPFLTFRCRIAAKSQVMMDSRRERRGIGGSSTREPARSSDSRWQSGKHGNDEQVPHREVERRRSPLPASSASDTLGDS